MDVKEEEITEEIVEEEEDFIGAIKRLMELTDKELDVKEQQEFNKEILNMMTTVVEGIGELFNAFKGITTFEKLKGMSEMAKMFEEATMKGEETSRKETGKKSSSVIYS